MSLRSVSRIGPGSPLVAVVDDDGPVLHMTGRLLNAWGYRVLLFDDPRTALIGLVAAPVDAAVIDFSMPYLDGPDLARRLRSAWRGIGPALLLVSGQVGRLPEADRALFDGGVFRKPVDPEAFEDALAGAVARSMRVAPGAPARSTSDSPPPPAG